MNRTQLIDYIQGAFDAEPEYLWKRWENYAVFRHTDNRKWFALVMDVPSEKLGIEGEEAIDIVNVKADPDLIDELLRSERGFLPAYHMNKRSWVSILLDGSVSLEKIETLVAESFEKTCST